MSSWDLSPHGCHRSPSPLLPVRTPPVVPIECTVFFPTAGYMPVGTHFNTKRARLSPTSAAASRRPSSSGASTSTSSRRSGSASSGSWKQAGGSGRKPAAANEFYIHTPPYAQWGSPRQRRTGLALAHPEGKFTLIRDPRPRTDLFTREKHLTATIDAETNQLKITSRVEEEVVASRRWKRGLPRPNTAC